MRVMVRIYWNSFVPLSAVEVSRSELVIPIAILPS